MIKELHKVLEYLPTLIKAKKQWKSESINKDGINVERLFAFHGKNTIYLQKMNKAKVPSFHTHEHNLALRVVEGHYRMGIGTKDSLLTKVVLAPGSEYEITNPKCQHYTSPVFEPCYTIMVTNNEIMEVTNPLVPPKYEELYNRWQEMVTNCAV